MLPATSILTALISLVTNHYYEDAKEIYQQRTLDTYDFIIVGAGASGSVIASRLSEVTNWKILLLEEGGASSRFSDIPRLYKTVQTKTPAVIFTETVPQSGRVCSAKPGNRCWLNLGHSLGGGSALNSMIYTRLIQGYERWESLGADGWTVEKIKKYLRQQENVTDVTPANYPSNLSGRGKSGPLQVTYGPLGGNDQLAELFLNAAKELGYNVGDVNKATGSIFDHGQRMIYNGVRTNAFRSHILPVNNDRFNLEIVTLASVKRIIFSGNRATGVVYTNFKGEEVVVTATKEVILSAGAIGTPGLLLKSGVGPEEELSRLGINVVLDSPQVGKGLIDHPQLSLNISTGPPTMQQPFTRESVEEYNQEEKMGPLTVNRNVAIGLLTTKNSDNSQPRVSVDMACGSEENDDCQLYAQLIAPKSVGTVRLNPVPVPEGNLSTYTNDLLINPNYLTRSEDVEDLVEGVRALLNLLNTKTFRRRQVTIQGELDPLNRCDGSANLLSDKYLRCIASAYLVSNGHYCCTARMGSVTNAELKVIGLSNLRIVDLSVAPDTPHGFTQSAAQMIAERASNMIKNQWLRNRNTNTKSTGVKPIYPLKYFPKPI